MDSLMSQLTLTSTGLDWTQPWPKQHMKPMKRNDLVRVFQKPITNEGYEGMARLYRHFKEEDDPELGERWTVRFANGDMCDRWVHKRNLVRD